MKDCSHKKAKIYPMKRGRLMNGKKRFLVLIFIISNILFICSCGYKFVPKRYEAENEIQMYEYPKEGKTQITIGIVGNVFHADKLGEKFEQNHKVQIRYRYLVYGDEEGDALKDVLEHENDIDILICASKLPATNWRQDYFDNLSSNYTTNRYHTSLLVPLAEAGKLYAVPGPYSLIGILYNKTLFEQYEWTLPKTYPEFLRLCKQIEEDTSGTVEAFNSCAMSKKEFLTGFTGFAGNEQLLNISKRKSYEKYRSGEAGLKGYIEPLFQVVAKAYEEGQLTKADWEKNETARLQEFYDGKIAMISAQVDSIFHHEGEYEYGMIPFPGTNQEENVILQRPAYYTSIVTQKSRTSKEQRAILEYLDFISSTEAMELYVEEGFLVAHIKGGSVANSMIMNEIEPEIQYGDIYPIHSYNTDENVTVETVMVEYMEKMLEDHRTIEETIEQLDSYLKEEHHASVSENAIAYAEKDFTMLETSYLISDILRDRAKADIGLFLHLVPQWGNNSSLYEGAITRKNITNMMPTVFGYESRLIRGRITGKNLHALLQNPRCGQQQQAFNAIYAASGLYLEVAPYRKVGEKIRKLTLEDKSEIIPDKIYTIAFWKGTIEEAYLEGIDAEYEESFVDILTEELREMKKVSPNIKHKISIMWNS